MSCNSFGTIKIYDNIGNSIGSISGFNYQYIDIKPDVYLLNSIHLKDIYQNIDKLNTIYTKIINKDSEKFNAIIYLSINNDVLINILTISLDILIDNFLITDRCDRRYNSITYAISISRNCEKLGLLYDFIEDIKLQSYIRNITIEVAPKLLNLYNNCDYKSPKYTYKRNC